MRSDLDDNPRCEVCGERVFPEDGASYEDTGAGLYHISRGGTKTRITCRACVQDMIRVRREAPKELAVAQSLRGVAEDEGDYIELWISDPISP